MGDQQVYDPVLKQLISPEEADALNSQRRAASMPGAPTMAISHDQSAGAPPPGEAFLGFRAPGDRRDQDVGLHAPPMAEEDARSILMAFPQLAGLIAQVVPQLAGARAGATAAFAVPAVVEGLRQLWNGEDVQPLRIATEGVKGEGAHLVGAGINRIGETGVDWVRRALALSKGQFANGAEFDAAIKELPKLAIKEGAQMTEAGANAIRASGTSTLPGGAKVTLKSHQALADALDNARREAMTSPNRITFWPNEMAANVLRHPPRELAMGQAMASPFGIDTSKVIAPGVEAAIRALMINHDATKEAPVTSGPRRRQR